MDNIDENGSVSLETCRVDRIGLLLNQSFVHGPWSTKIFTNSY